MTDSLPDYYDHPVFHRHRLHLDTPAIARLKEDIQRWVWTGATGGVVTGPSRAGKTTALQTLMSQIHTRGQVQIPSYFLSVPPVDSTKMAAVSRMLCLSANLRALSSDRGDVMSDRYVHYLADQAAERGCDYAILFVDEFEGLQARQLKPFAYIYNALMMLGIVLVTVFVGNDREAADLIKLIQTNKHYDHIRGRFFTQQTTFGGLMSRQEVQECLKQYDTLQFPLNGPTYTAFFLPEEAAVGWRLESLSADLWRVFRDYEHNYAIDSWGMQYFTATINALLTDFLPSQGVDNFDDEMVHKAIDISGLLPSQVRPGA